MWNEIARNLQQGNPYMITMLVLGFLGTVVFLERLIMLQFVFNINFRKFIDDLKKAVHAGDMERAASICKSSSPTSLPFISLKALEAADTDVATVRGTIDERTLEFLPRIEMRLGFLPAVSTLIILVGVLGTIDALWGAFTSIEVLDTAEKQAMLANGIARSLNPTSMGLIFCMLFLASNQLLKSMAITLTERIHHGVTVIGNLLAPPETVAMAAPMMSQAATMAAVATAAAAPASFNEASEGLSEKIEGGDENFDDASVADIKDEEEII